MARMTKLIVTDKTKTDNVTEAIKAALEKKVVEKAKDKEKAKDWFKKHVIITKA